MGGWVAVGPVLTPPPPGGAVRVRHCPLRLRHYRSSAAPSFCHIVEPKSDAPPLLLPPGPALLRASAWGTAVSSTYMKKQAVGNSSVRVA